MYTQVYFHYIEGCLHLTIPNTLNISVVFTCRYDLSSVYTDMAPVFALTILR